MPRTRKIALPFDAVPSVDYSTLELYHRCMGIALKNKEPKTAKELGEIINGFLINTIYIESKSNSYEEA